MTTAFTFNPFTGNFDVITTGLSPSDITGGTPNTLSGFDSTGTLFSPPGLGFLDQPTASYGIQINPVWATTVTDIQPLRIEGNVDGQTGTSFTGIDLTTNFGNNAIPTTGTNIQQVAFFGTYGADFTSNNAIGFFDAGRIVDGANVGDVISFQASMTIDQAVTNTYRAFQSGTNIGSNDPAHVNGYVGVGIFDQFAQFADIDNASGISVSNNMLLGSVVDGYTAINVSNNIDTTMNGYRGVELGANFGGNGTTTINNHIDFQSHPSYQAPATLGSYTGLAMDPTFVEGSTVQNIQMLSYNADIRGTVTGNVAGLIANNNLGNGTSPVSITNYSDVNFNPNLGANLTLGNYQGFTLRANVQTGATITGDVNLMNLGVNGTLPVAGNARGITVDMTNFQTAQLPQGLQIQGSTQLNAQYDTGTYPVQSGGGPYGLNNIGGNFHVAAGFPITGGNFGIGNNLGIGINIDDDVPPDSSGVNLGFVMNGFLTQIGVAAGKSMASLTFMGAGAQNAYPGTGTFDEINMFRAIGILPTAGATINNIYGFKVDALLSAASPLNAWGVWVGDTNADNWFAKDVVIGGNSMKPSNSDVALEVASLKAIKLPSLTTTQRNALSPLESMFIYNDTTNGLEFYNGTSWIASSAGAGTVTSVDVSVPSYMSSTGGPITTSGTIALSFNNESANMVFAGPATGGPAAPSFRALVAADIPTTISIGALDAQAANANGLALVSNVLSTQSADATHPGMVNTTSQTFAGSKTFSSLLNADGGIDRSTSGTLTIGATNSTTINIGNAGATINIQGTTIYENTPILQSAAPLITVNHGGGAGSGQNSGIQVEEAAVITGYNETSSDRNSWILKAPNTAGIATITPGASGITLDQSSHNPVTIGTANGLSLSTQVLSLALSSTSTTGALSSTDWNTFNGKQAAGNYITALTGDVVATGPGSVSATIQPLAVTNAKIANATIDLTTKVTGTLPIANGGTGVTSLGDLTDVGTDGITITSGTGALIHSASISQHVADSTHNGYLSSTDWSTFNNKQPAGSYVTAVSVVSANGLAGSSSGGTTPALTLSTTITGILQGNGTAISAATTTGSGSVVLSNSPTLVTPALGTPSALVGTNITGTASGLTAGTVTTNANLTGDITSVGNATTYNNTVPIAKGGTGQTTKAAAFDALSPMTTGGDIIYGGASGTGTRLANGSSGQVLTSNGGTAAPSWQTPSGSSTAPKVTAYTSGSGTFTRTGSPLYIKVQATGGGGGGGGSGSTSGNAGGAGGNTTFGTSLVTAGGAGAQAGATSSGSGGSPTAVGLTGILLTGGSGEGSSTIGTTNTAYIAGGSGSAGPYGGTGGGGPGGVAGSAAAANTGAGGGGGGGVPGLNMQVGAGGAAGAYVEVIIPSPASTYSYSIGTGGSGGAAGSSGNAGGNGGSGFILVTEYYQ